ncbi:MAG: hypothetical protein AAF547_07595 [Actinomycetota bacterium]
MVKVRRVRCLRIGVMSRWSGSVSGRDAYFREKPDERALYDRLNRLQKVVYYWFKISPYPVLPELLILLAFWLPWAYSLAQLSAWISLPKVFPGDFLLAGLILLAWDRIFTAYLNVSPTMPFLPLFLGVLGRLLSARRVAQFLTAFGAVDLLHWMVFDEPVSQRIIPT